MIRPKVFPGELDRSYLGAVMRMNGMQDEKATIALMAQWAGAPNCSSQTTPVIELLSQTAGVPTELFVQQHSTIAFHRATTSRLSELPHGSLEHRAVLSKHGLRRTRANAYFCINCIDSDQSELNRSYWRREHQMPGLYWCPKHHIGLNSTEAANAFSRSPSEFVDTSNQTDYLWIAELRRSKPIQRFLEIVSAFMETRTPFHAMAVRYALRQQGRLVGFCRQQPEQTGRSARDKEFICESIKGMFPGSWLEREFPGIDICGNRRDQTTYGIDGVFGSGKARTSVASYALMASVLFETGDDAVAAFIASSKRQREKRRSRAPHKLLETYVSSLEGDEEIGRRTGAFSLAMLRIFADVGFTNLKDGPSGPLLKAARMFYVHDRSISESAAASGVSRSVLKALVKQAGERYQIALLEIDQIRKQRKSIQQVTELVPCH